MDLSGRTNMDLTEAARLLKQSTTPSTLTNPAQMQPPPLMMMQQAVAMQQFQFQQALLMQQVMATQQAAARAATVKSAAEMAAARAAEISKQLKGSDAEEEEEKKPAAKSPSRSKSCSPSRSRSASRSKSRSPIRYRRDRSASRSPIRYRRDRAYSPSRSRDFYSYRSRSRRGYYRGRGDYPWNPFRREWDRDRDRDYYPRSRRSRSRSRSRVRRRSRTRSRSPRFRRERTPSPRYKRDERKAIHGSRRSRSRDTKRTPSLSSRSPSASPHRHAGSRSPPGKLQESGEGGVRRGASGSPGPNLAGRCGEEFSGSLAKGENVGSPDAKQRESDLPKDERPERDAIKDSELRKREVSASPARSLSVSLDQTLRKDPESEDEVDVKIKAKKISAGLSTVEESDVEDHQLHPKLGMSSDVKAKEASSDISSDEGHGDKKSKGQLLGKQSRSIKRGERSHKGQEFPKGEESEDDKGLDDWRDDMKPVLRERTVRRDGRRDHDRNVEEEKKPSKEFARVDVPSFSDSVRAEPMQTQQGSSKKATKKNAQHASVLDSEQPDCDEEYERKSRAGAVRKELRRQESFRYRGKSPLEEKNEVIDLKDNGRFRISADDNLGGHEIGGHNLREVKEEDMADEGGSLLQGDIQERTMRPVLVEDYQDVERVDKVAAADSRVKYESEFEDKEEAKFSRPKPVLEEEDTIVSRKKSEKSRSKDRRVDEEDRDKRRERHKKHRRKHRRDEEDEKDEDDEEKVDGEGHKERRRHKRKHRKEEDDERREKKRRKHRSRGKSVSDSDGKSPRADVEARRNDDDESPVRRKSSSRKKSSGRHRKRRRDPSKSPANGGSSTE